MKTNARDPRVTKLLSWFHRHGRTLPWRFIDNPYHIFVSEIMLQQTQASRVIDFYQAWLKTFPTWESLASASTPKLLRAWAGLGYNRRALYIREAARHVVEFGLPKSEEEWRLLKGVGPYTAAAVYAFTAKKPTFAIDTNIRRVIGRSMFGIVTPEIRDDANILKQLKKSLTHKNDWIALHALMDIGAMICLPRNPKCDLCPFKDSCKAKKALSTHAAPVKRKKTTERIHNGKKYPDRIYRGRILKIIREKKNISIHNIGSMIDEQFEASNDQDWIVRMVDRMKQDGFIEEKNNLLSITAS